MKKLWLFMIVSLILVSFVLADNETNATENVTVDAGYDVNITAIDDEVKMDETAKFLVSIEGDFSVITEFRIYSAAVEWDIPEKRLKLYPLTGKGEVELEATQLHINTPGIHGIPIHIKNTITDELTKKNIYVTLRTGDVTAGMNPSVRIDINMSDEVNPGEELNVNVDFVNKNLLSLSNLRYEVTSSLEEIYSKGDLDDLAALGKNSLDLSYSLDSMEAAGENTVTVDLYQNNKVIKSATKKFNIIELRPSFLESLSSNNVFLKVIKEITYTSEANVVDVQTLLVETNWLERLMTTTSNEADVVSKDGDLYYSFNLQLAPQERQTITVITNYRLLVYLLIVLIIIGLLYHRYNSPLTIKKTLTQVGTEEGGVSEMKIMLEVHNRGKKDIKNVTIRDPIPNLVEVKKEFAAGTLKPSKYLRGKDKSMVLEWKVDELAAGENRLIGYNIKSRLSIIGSFKLPRGKVYFIKKGKQMIAYSNSVSVNG